MLKLNEKTILILTIVGTVCQVLLKANTTEDEKQGQSTPSL